MTNVGSHSADSAAREGARGAPEPSVCSEGAQARCMQGTAPAAHSCRASPPGPCVQHRRTLAPVTTSESPWRPLRPFSARSSPAGPSRPMRRLVQRESCRWKPPCAGCCLNCQRGQARARQVEAQRDRRGTRCPLGRAQTALSPVTGGSVATLRRQLPARALAKASPGRGGSTRCRGSGLARAMNE